MRSTFNDGINRKHKMKNAINNNPICLILLTDFFITPSKKMPNLKKQTGSASPQASKKITEPQRANRFGFATSKKNAEPQKQTWFG